MDDLLNENKRLRSLLVIIRQAMAEAGMWPDMVKAITKALDQDTILARWGATELEPVAAPASEPLKSLSENDLSR